MSKKAHLAAAKMIAVAVIGTAVLVGWIYFAQWMTRDVSDVITGVAIFTPIIAGLYATVYYASRD